MTNDRELLELAAKAAGMFFDQYQECWYENGEMSNPAWNPLTDDGDALRLAVKLNLCVFRYINMVTARQVFKDWECDERDDDDPYAATRRAIVRAAAEIGKEMK